MLDPNAERLKLLEGLEDCGARGLDVLQSAVHLNTPMSEIIGLFMQDEEARRAFDKGITRQQQYYINRMKEEEAGEGKNAMAARQWLLNHYDKQHQAIYRMGPQPQINAFGDTKQHVLIEDQRKIAILDDYQQRQQNT